VRWQARAERRRCRRPRPKYDSQVNSQAQPTLSVIVPIYNVGSYLAPCLDSILGSTLADIEVICVDDGSTDSSGGLADSYAERDRRVRVLHVENGGLGRARNIGTDAARGRYLAFADSDDRVPPDAYELMCESLGASGSDFASGRVRRFTETRVWNSGPHLRAIPYPARGTHISRMRSLLYDTTAWNKVFRRDFWDAHQLQFPEGVLYEDMCLMTTAHVLAGKVDLIRAPVYDWRVRGDGSLSITQRRVELDNMLDRFTAIHCLSDFLIGRDDKQLLRAFDVKVLTIDFPIYIGVIDTAEPEYQRAFMQNVQRVLAHMDDHTLYQASVWDHVVLELLRRSHLAEALEVLEARRLGRALYEITRRGTRVFADLPYFRDRRVAVPDHAYDVTNRLPVKAAVERMEIRDGALAISGHALISGVHMDHPWSSVRYLVLGSKATGNRIVRVLAPKRRPDLTANFGSELGGYDYAGFETRVPLSDFHAPERGDAQYDVQIKVVTLGARRGVKLKCQDRAYLKKGPISVTATGEHIAVYETDGQQLRIAVCRDAALLEDVAIDDDAETIRCRVRVPGMVVETGRLTWECEHDTMDGVSAELVTADDDPSVGTATFRIGDFHGLPVNAGERLWQASLELDSNGAATERPVLGRRQFPRLQVEDPSRRRELAVRIGRRGRLTLIDRVARCRVEGLRLQHGKLTVDVVLPLSAPATDDAIRFSLLNDSMGSVAPESVTRHGRNVSLIFSVIDSFRGRALAPGHWSLAIDDCSADRATALRLEVDTERIARTEQSTGDETTSARLLLQEGRVQIWVRHGRAEDRGPRNQHLLQTRYYPRARQQPLQDVVLFQSWAGKQYSCNPRAVFEEMRRQGRSERALWVRRNAAVNVPDGVPWVQMWSREYYEALATARYVVSNDAMPVYFAKQPGSNYLQTWHGTPLKRIGFDVENLNLNNPRYLEEFAVEVTKWDQLISPNAYSTEIFRRAFGYQGEMLETGYPRNDIFYAPNVDDLRAEVRGRLGVEPDRRVILWAPTWRDDQRDASGRYSLPMPFELSTWDRILDPDDVLLFRGHQLLRETTGGMLRGLRSVRNVTLYPDIQDLYLAADVLITDYSSVMFDFANTRRPMIFYTWDLEMYRDKIRGFYVDFENDAPGPVVTDLAGLHKAITEIDAAAKDAEGRYARFVERYCGLEDGKASARVVDAIFGAR
jgi:CDP-glycerol glycerophosphotransferase